MHCCDQRLTGTEPSISPRNGGSVLAHSLFVVTLHNTKPHKIRSN